MDYRLEYIKIEDLKNGYLYKIMARNASIGIWEERQKWFIISRFKFGTNYIFSELHWDADEHFGTVKPLEEIEKSPFNKFELNNSEMLDYLNEKELKTNGRLA